MKRCRFPPASTASTRVHTRLPRTSKISMRAGSYEARWDRRSEDGARAPAGVYFVSLSVAGESARQRVIVVNQAR